VRACKHVTVARQSRLVPAGNASVLDVARRLRTAEFLHGLVRKLTRASLPKRIFGPRGSKSGRVASAWLPEERRRVDVEGRGQPAKSPYAWIPSPSFEVANVAALHIGSVRDLLLRQAALSPEGANVPP
jgi:hypothetical protein